MFDITQLRKIFFVFVLLYSVSIIFYSKTPDSELIHMYEFTFRRSLPKYAEFSLERSLEGEKGAGCDLPKLDPHAPEIMWFRTAAKPIKCTETSWVTCYKSTCSLRPEIFNKLRNIQCYYSDMIYFSDISRSYYFPQLRKGLEVYNLTWSDHVKIICSGFDRIKYVETTWAGFGAGFRRKVSRVKPSNKPDERDSNYDVMIIGFAKTSNNGFLRMMPKSYKLLKDLGAIVLNGHNVLRQGAASTMFPMLSGKTEFDTPPEAMKRPTKEKVFLNEEDFIFHKVKQLGYRTAYFEDRPWAGAFNQHYNGFRKQPADHYLRDPFIAEWSGGGWYGSHSKYCFGDTPRFELMLNLTEQFFQMDGRKFGFTFISDISHENFNLLQLADEPLAGFLKRMNKRGAFRKTLLIVMGEHGPRFPGLGSTYQGVLEDRLPFMAIRLPDRLRINRRAAKVFLKANKNVLTTPHDIYATILDVLNLTRFWNPYKVKGADLTRALTLLQPVPRERSCSEAGIEPHWCSCSKWETVSHLSAAYVAVAKAVVDHINHVNKPLRHLCVERTLESIKSVKKRVVAAAMKNTIDVNASQVYRAKVIVGPKKAEFEATVIYITEEKEFLVDPNEVFRKDIRNSETQCISGLFLFLKKYCYCDEKVQEEIRQKKIEKERKYDDEED